MRNQNANSKQKIVIKCNEAITDEAVNKNLENFQLLQAIDGNKYETTCGPILDEGIVWKYDGVSGVVPFAGTYTGLKGVKNFWRDFKKSVTSPKITLRYFVHQDNIIHLHLIEEGIVKSTGKKYKMETAQRWEYNEKGALTKFRWYNDPFALFHAFQPETDPKLSIAVHTADYKINGDGPVDALSVVQNFYLDFATGDMAVIMGRGRVPNDIVVIMAGPESITKIAGTWLGARHLTEFFNTLFACTRYNAFTPLTVLADGCKVDVEFHEEIIISDTGKVASCDGLHSFIVNTKGQVLKFRSTNDSYNCAWAYTN